MSLEAVIESMLTRSPPTAEAWKNAILSRASRKIKSMVKRGADIEQVVDDYTALQRAALHNLEDIVRLLIDLGADIHAKGTQGRTALDLARQNYAAEAIGVLEKAASILEEQKKEKNVSVSDDTLSRAIQSRDCQRVRDIFDGEFWKDSKVSVSWDQLKIAVLQEDEPMMRLLITWDARAPEDTAQLEGVSAEQYDRYIKILRQAGLPAPRLVERPVAVIEQSPEDPWVNKLEEFAETIPQEWKTVLEAFQAEGAKEAIIAGGALRDTFNGRAVKDVDIFLKDRGGKKQNKAFLKNVFATAGLRVKPQVIGYTEDDYRMFEIREEFPDPKVKKQRTGWILRKKVAESWTIVAGPEDREYNLVFISGPMQGIPETDFGRAITDGFDFGLCQIFFDGQKVVATPSYKADVQNKKISLIAKNDSSAEHLGRIMLKYPDWALCAESKKVYEQSEAERMAEVRKSLRADSWGGY